MMLPNASARAMIELSREQIAAGLPRQFSDLDIAAGLADALKTLSNIVVQLTDEIEKAKMVTINTCPHVTTAPELPANAPQPSAPPELPAAPKNAALPVLPPFAAVLHHHRNTVNGLPV
jgi:hypothetical protein